MITDYRFVSANDSHACDKFIAKVHVHFAEFFAIYIYCLNTSVVDMLSDVYTSNSNRCRGGQKSIV